MKKHIVRPISYRHKQYVSMSKEAAQLQQQLLSHWQRK